jgi:FixJ family two-component response regulator
MTESQPAWVLVVDDDAGVRSALQHLLAAAGFRVASLASADGLLEDPRVHLPCCLVLDVKLPGTSGLEVQRRLEDAGLDVPIVFLTGHGNVGASVQAMKRGAIDFLEKPVDPQALLGAVRHALERGSAARERAHRLADYRRRFETLSVRERSVVDAMVRGLPNKQIAGALGLSERTVKFHRANVMGKMRVGSTAELATMMEQLKSHPRLSRARSE